MYFSYKTFMFCFLIKNKFWKMSSKIFIVQQKICIENHLNIKKSCFPENQSIFQ